MKAFVTGSCAYGLVKKDSDVDLVVFVSDADMRLLEKFADSGSTLAKGRPPSAEGEQGIQASLRFGRLNLLCVTDPIAYEVWRRGTVLLEREGEVTRDLAVRLFSMLREWAGLKENQPTVSDARNSMRGGR